MYLQIYVLTTFIMEGKVSYVSDKSLHVSDDSNRQLVVSANK